MTLDEIWAAWLFALFSIAILSYLWKITIVYRLAEAFSVGSLTAHVVITTYTGSIENIGIIPIMSGQYVRIIPLVLGLLVFTRFVRKYGWVSRYPTAVLTGVGIGVMFGATFRAQIIAQIGNTVSAFHEIDIVGAILTLVGMVTVLSYFIYTHEQKGPLGISAKIGRLFAMFSFGLNFSAEIVYYLTVMVGILIILYDTWIKGAILGQ